MLLQNDPETFGCLNSVSLVTLLTMQLDYPIQRRTRAIRILYFATCLLGFIVYCNYTATLTSWMTAKEPPLEINVRGSPKIFWSVNYTKICYQIENSVFR